MSDDLLTLSLSRRFPPSTPLKEILHTLAFVQEPARLPVFIVNSSRPFNAEPPPELLLDAGFITPNELYYVRNHLPVPLIDPKKYRLQVEVEGKAGRCVQYSLADLKNMFPNVRGVYQG